MRYDLRITVYHQIQARRMKPEWLLSRLYWQGASTVLTRRLLQQATAVWWELPRRLLSPAFSPRRPHPPPVHLPVVRALAARLCHWLHQGDIRLARHRSRDRTGRNPGGGMIFSLILVTSPDFEAGLPDIAGGRRPVVLAALPHGRREQRRVVPHHLQST